MTEVSNWAIEYNLDNDKDLSDKELKKVLALLDEERAKLIKLSSQDSLDDENKKKLEQLRKNIEKVREELAETLYSNPVKFNFSISYWEIKKTRGNTSSKNFGWFQWDVKNIDEYVTSWEVSRMEFENAYMDVQNSRLYESTLSLINQNNDLYRENNKLETRDGSVYWDFWNDILWQYYRKEITLDRLWELDREPFQRYLNWEYISEESKEIIANNNAIIWDNNNQIDENRSMMSDNVIQMWSNIDQIDKHTGRNLSKTEIALLDAIKNQRTREDVDTDILLSDLLWDLIFEESTDWEISVWWKEVDKTTVSPLDILEEQFKNSSEEDKLELARVMSAYMRMQWYDNELLDKQLDLAKDKKLVWDVSSETIWETYKNWWVAWICMHHSSEVAKMLTRLWFTSWTLSTNNWKWKHYVTWWKKEDGTYFLIDEWDYYESRDPKEMKARYLMVKWWVDLKEFVTDKDWNTIQIMQTDLEKAFENISSSIWTWDIKLHTKEITRNGDKIERGYNIDINSDSENSTKLSYNYWWEYFSWWVFYNEIKNLDYADYESAWLEWRFLVWENTDMFWQLWWWLKIWQHKFSWQNWKESSYVSWAIDLSYVKELYSSDSTKLWLWLSGQIIVTKHDENWLNDVVSNTWLNLWLSHKLLDNLEWTIDYTVWRDKYIANTRTDTSISETWSKRITLWLKWEKFSWEIYRDDMIGTEKTWINLSWKVWKLDVSVGYEKEDNIDNWLLLDSATKKIWFVYNVNDAVRVSVGYNDVNNWISKTSMTNVWLDVRF